MLQGTRKDPSKRHGHKGKKGCTINRGKKVAYASLRTFFAELQEEGLPFATRLIQERTGLTTRDDNPDDVALPPHFTKHQLYTKWCWSR